MQDTIKRFKLFVYDVIYQMRKVRSDLSIFLSRKILKNDGGFDLYIWGQIKHALIKALSKKKSFSASVSDQNKTVVSFLHENKYAPVTLDISDNLVTRIREKSDRLIEDKDFSYVRGARQGNTEDVFYTRAMKDIVKNIPEVKEILTPELKALIQQYFGCNFGMTSVLFWRNYHVPEGLDNRVRFSNDWHNDNIAPTELKLFVNMTDVTEDHGPLHVIPAGITKQLVAQGAFKGRKSKNDLAALENKDHIVKHIGKAGSAVFAHASYCLHRADIPAEGNYRDMLEFQFHPALAPLSDNWDSKNLKYA